ncbi:RluA family pseudouridine synthase [Treponema ruminis]|uniref:tRNA pseudouridine32 synthase/23S rRNA pseudouridine746 synthase n=1 Tax=Treponema ruminis TaxID=744515 RepID=A0A7W8G9S0_9SPIR|nr:RluA family pseudouridine synthase [Treponema ruminis]MBB5226477.1 tRNA pseudouridine32 synthase/23S rRNA pseudouridine746 synthase [Treponema ruminis]QSI02618.1 RluA family pseudouridine synthase [Treponema ruminis]
MFPPLPQEKAAKILEKLIQSLEKGELVLAQVARVSEERKNQGVMLGALVCKDKNGDEINLVTNSGNAKEIRNVQSATNNEKDGNPNADTKFFQLSNFNFQFVSPIVSSEEIEEALSENDAEIHEITKRLKSGSELIRGGSKNAEKSYEDLRKLREKLCAQSLEKVHALYKFHCIDGKVRTLKEICANYNGGKLPPTGTGDCCAPKLFDYAFAHELMPISLAETTYTAPSGRDCSTAEGVPRAVWSESGSAESPTAKPDRPDFQLTPPCDERCGILLPAILGLRILYRDDSICVVNKQSGLLSVPGRGEDKQDCIESRFKRLFGDKVEIVQTAVHRLDMETSGVMILAFTKEAHRTMMRQFEAKEVQKEYVALLDDILPKMGIAPHGKMELFFRLDVDNRPHQIWDAENGKSAVTEWQILGVERYHAPDGFPRNATRVLFMPHTGRTHQLRLASADSHGFGCPIIGDTLYGHCDEGERLMLHARKITFTHPVTGERMTIECQPEF